MVEVTDAMVEAFGKAWYQKRGEQLGKVRVPGAKTRAGLEAVFALLDGGTTQPHIVGELVASQDVGTYEPVDKRVNLVFWSDGSVTWEERRSGQGSPFDFWVGAAND